MNIGVIIGISLAVIISSISRQKMIKEYKEKQRKERLKNNFNTSAKTVLLKKEDKIEENHSEEE